jgi:integrase
MRIGECVDLSYDCLRNVGPDRWAIHVPLGKFKTERMVPVDAFVCELVQRLRFFRSFDPLPPDGWLLSRPDGKQALIRQLRYCLHEVTAAAGITTRIVPHQLRHYAASRTMPRGCSRSALKARRIWGCVRIYPSTRGIVRGLRIRSGLRRATWGLHDRETSAASRDCNTAPVLGGLLQF